LGRPWAAAHPIGLSGNDHRAQGASRVDSPTCERPADEHARRQRKANRDARDLSAGDARIARHESDDEDRDEGDQRLGEQPLSDVDAVGEGGCAELASSRAASPKQSQMANAARIAGELCADVGGHAAPREASDRRLSDRHGRVQVTARHGSDCRHDPDQGDAEAQRDGQRVIRGPAMGRCSAPATATEQPTKTKMNVPTSSATSGRAVAPPVLLLYSAISTPLLQVSAGVTYLPSDRPKQSEPAYVPTQRPAPSSAMRSGGDRSDGLTVIECRSSQPIAALRDVQHRKPRV
jgi:hypothetical protein